MVIVKSNLVLAATSALGLMAATSPAMAEVLGAVKLADNFTFTSGTPVLLATSQFTLNNGDVFVATFASECAVNAPDGNTSAWTDIDIQLLDSSNVVISTLSPTIGSGDAFCTANGTVGFDGWVTASMTVVGGPNNGAGNYSVRVIGRLDGGAT